MKCVNSKKAISLIILVITMIVVTILAVALILFASDSNIISNVKMAKFKSDMQNFKSKYTIWVANMISENTGYDVLDMNYSAKTDKIYEILGAKIPEEYASNLCIVNGKLVYITEDENQNDILASIDMKYEKTFKLKYSVVTARSLNSLESVEWCEDIGNVLNGKAGFIKLNINANIIHTYPTQEKCEQYLIDKYCLEGSNINNLNAKSDEILEQGIVDMFALKNFEEYLQLNGYTDKLDFEEKSGKDTYTDALLAVIFEDGIEVEGNIISNGYMLDYVPNLIFQKTPNKDELQEYLLYLYDYTSIDNLIKYLLEELQFDSLQDLKSEYNILNDNELYKVFTGLSTITYACPIDIICKVTSQDKVYIKNAVIDSVGNIYCQLPELGDQNNVSVELVSGAMANGSISLCNISYELDEVNTSNNATKIKEGDSYETILSIEEENTEILGIIVKMNNVDITEEVLDANSNTILIPEVIGDIVIGLSK